MIDPNASNWVDRGEPAGPKLARALHHAIGRDVEVEDDVLLGHAAIILGMVEADASEVQIAAYLGDIQEEIGVDRSAGRDRRQAAIAMWHIGKAALVRDHTIRVLEKVRELGTAEQPRLSEWLKERLMRDEDDERPAPDGCSGNA